MVGSQNGVGAESMRGGARARHSHMEGTIGGQGWTI